VPLQNSVIEGSEILFNIAAISKYAAFYVEIEANLINGNRHAINLV